jgi:hypothetical protein
MKKQIFLVSVSSPLSTGSSIKLDSPSVFQNVNYSFKLNNLEGRATFQYIGYFNDEGKFVCDFEFIDINFLMFNGRKIEIGYKVPEWNEFEKSYKSLFGKDIYEVIEATLKFTMLLCLFNYYVLNI